MQACVAPAASSSNIVHILQEEAAELAIDAGRHRWVAQAAEPHVTLLLVRPRQAPSHCSPELQLVDMMRTHREQ